MRLPVAITLLATCTASALPVQPPVERELTAADGRTMRARVVGVTETAIEFVRNEDAARFTLPLERLSLGDRDFATDLHKRLVAAQPLPDTPFLQAVRKDFLRAVPDGKKMVPLAASDFASAPRLLLAVYPYAPPTASLWTGRNLEGLNIQELPVLWMFSSADKLQISLLAETLPAAHAVLSYEAMAPAVARADEIVGKESSDAYRRRPPKDGEVWYLFTNEEDESAFEKKLLAKLPPYWPCMPRNSFNQLRRHQAAPYVFLVERDGRPTLFRDVPVSGNLATVVKVLREHADELKPGPAPAR